MGMFIEQVALKRYHQSQSMLAATPDLPNRDENESTEQWQPALENHGHWKERSEASFLAQNGTEEIALCPQSQVPEAAAHQFPTCSWPRGHRVV